MFSNGSKFVHGIFCASTVCDFLNEATDANGEERIFCQACGYPLQPKRARMEVPEEEERVEERVEELPDGTMVYNLAPVPRRCDELKRESVNKVLEEDLNEVEPIERSVELGDGKYNTRLRARAAKLGLPKIALKLDFEAAEKEEKKLEDPDWLGMTEDPAIYEPFMEEETKFYAEEAEAKKKAAEEAVANIKIIDANEDELSRDSFPN